MEYLSVDRIENSVAICENEDMSTIKLPLSLLPNGIREGSIIAFENGVYTIDKSEEVRRKERISKLQNLIFDDN